MMTLTIHNGGLLKSLSWLEKHSAGPSISVSMEKIKKLEAVYFIANMSSMEGRFMIQDLPIMLLTSQGGKKGTG